MTRVLVFGTFDGLHDGHRSFLEQAKSLGNELFVCVARDAIVSILKGRPTRYREEERVRGLQESGLADTVMLGDAELGTYGCVNVSGPDIIALGYDQDALREHLTNWIAEEQRSIRVQTLLPYKPETFKSSLLDV